VQAWGEEKGDEVLPIHTSQRGRFVMKVGGRAFKRSMIAFAVGAMALTSVSVVRAADAEMQVEVAISDQGFNVKGVTTSGALTAIRSSQSGFNDSRNQLPTV
jgi:hypothetical protein